MVGKNKSNINEKKCFVPRYIRVARISYVKRKKSGNYNEKNSRRRAYK
jgi:hypothetical protein